MAQEFTIKSQDIENKINQLLPSQGGFQPGVDFSASTMVVPIVDLTETAEGSNLREDLQSSFSLIVSNAVSLSATSATDFINTTGFYRIYGNINLTPGSGTGFAVFQITDGTTTKILQQFVTTGSGNNTTHQVDFIVKLEAGDSMQYFGNSSSTSFIGNYRQLADINGNLTDP
tara:strand:+ start:126 stop:644 length:519 start_codon:yes stop_codon:yes gene_type:complete